VYQKKTQLEHILLRPDTYIGSVESVQCPMWVVDDNGRMVYRTINYVPGLFKIFDEILVNAADNKIRDKDMDVIKVNINRETNTISIYNNGKGIPIEIHAKEKVYVPELIFGHLLTSSNYDDSEKKVTGGRNGYGAKLCNIFSTQFTVETGDKKKGQKYKQVFTKNMSNIPPPKITETKTDDFTKITFKPDLAKFGMTTLDADIEALFKKRVYDLAGCVPGIKVSLNDTRIKLKNFKDYVELYLCPPPLPSGGGEEDAPITPAKKPQIAYERVNDRWEIAFALSEGQFQQISFVNSINTSKGGTHVNHVADQLVTALTEIVKKKDKKGGAAAVVKPFLVKSHMWIFVNCLIENPTFDSQTKENMTLRISAFGSKCTIGDDFMKKVLKSGVVDSILEAAKFKSDQAMKKTDGHKSSRISGISKLDDANQAGTKNGADCTLILTEGDSAKSLAVSGLSVVGRDKFGVFPLRGKLLNVREANSQTVSNNAEISALKKILGLQQKKEYTSVKDLRYGHIMIMTDQDHDGSHIKGLIINFLECYWPSLLKIPGFLQEFITPIVRVTPKNKAQANRTIDFFTIPEYEEWKRNNNDGRGYNIKYYKGLGTSTTEDAKKYFSNMHRHRKLFKKMDDADKALIDMAFNKKKADDRKEWLRSFQPGTFMDHSMREIPISDFINKELILFSLADNLRSIPSCVDGLKPGHRKILYSCFKRNLKSEIKVTQLAGYVSEHSAYHHGEASLVSTIVGMAQNYVGSNNLNLLEPNGQFGTRLQGGKDSASARYIFTNLNPMARMLFNPEDDVLLEYLNDDGQDIEPKWYIPILPLLLVNGSDGIGTGWSTSIPNYNPRDIIQNLIRLMNFEELEPMVPWFRGFNGTIEQVDKDKFKVTGVIKKLSDNTVEITELPIRTWTQTYKEMLEGWMVGDEAKKQVPWVKEFKEYHSDSRVHFVVTLTDAGMKAAEEEGLEKKFKLTTTVLTSNIVCFDMENRICKYETIGDLLKEFYQLRKDYYAKRKDAMMARMTAEWNKLDNKVRFIESIISGDLKVQNRKKADIVRDLKLRGFLSLPKGKPAAGTSTPTSEDASDDGDDDSGSGGYDYLLGMSIYSLTAEKVAQLIAERNRKQEEIDTLEKKTPIDLWRFDLDEFLVKWEEYETTMEEQEVNQKKLGVPQSKKGVKKPPAKKLKTKQDTDDEMEDDDFKIDFKDTKTKPKPDKMEEVTKTTGPKKLKQAQLSFAKPAAEEESKVSKSVASKTAGFASKKDSAKVPDKSTKPITSNVISLDVSIKLSVFGFRDDDDAFKFVETPPKKKTVETRFFQLDEDGNVIMKGSGSPNLSSVIADFDKPKPTSAARNLFGGGSSSKVVNLIDDDEKEEKFRKETDADMTDIVNLVDEDLAKSDDDEKDTKAGSGGPSGRKAVKSSGGGKKAGNGSAKKSITVDLSDTSPPKAKKRRRVVDSDEEDEGDGSGEEDDYGGASTGRKKGNGGGGGGAIVIDSSPDVGSRSLRDRSRRVSYKIDTGESDVEGDNDEDEFEVSNRNGNSKKGRRVVDSDDSDGGGNDYDVDNDDED
ncbi:DNA topoisomerase 2, partial [Blyttiomyces sp. JEL0837]